ncbi:MAG: hypothetical protein D6698_15040 [Gammaproteobacteria bacterium]|nr:MAG: hypothetical protein D6698_15040 [Gammaproteobacteria bacterium]
MNYQLKYGTKGHAKVKEKLLKRIRAAARLNQNNAQEWAENEDIFKAYIPTNEVDAERKSKRKNGEQDFVTLKIPYSYAVLMSAHTYWTSVFLGRDPVLQFAGRHGESEQKVQAVEAVMSYQTHVGGHMAPYYIWFLDAGKYGVGVIGEYWDEEWTQTSEIVEEEETYLGIPIPGKTKKVRRTRRRLSYKGNRVFNIRPQDFLYDGRVSLLNFQKGEFAGRFTETGWNDIVKGREYGQYYNIDALKKVLGKKQGNIGRGGGYNRDLGSPRVKLPESISGEETTYDLEPGFVNLTEMYIELIPKEWGLGNSSYPEKWVFTLAEDDVIIESQPFDSLHGQFPYAVLEYEMDGYQQVSRSMLDMLQPLNETMDWLFNSHFYNVRQILNGQFVIDPSRVTMKDFRSPEGGRLIRLKPEAYGTDPRTVIEQLPVADVTQGHLRDAREMADLIQRVSGVTDNIMGMLAQGGRKTATEVRSAANFGMNRLKTQCEFFSATGWAPHAQRLLMNTQQKYDDEMRFRLAGDLMDERDPWIRVSPDDISGFYDFIPVDGTMPVDRYAQVTLWTQLMGQIRQFPQIMEGYDIGRIFAHIAQLAGLKNIKRFQIQVVPDEEMLRQAENGNAIGVGGENGSSRGTGGNPLDATGVPGAAQFPGMGPAA